MEDLLKQRCFICRYVNDIDDLLKESEVWMDLYDYLLSIRNISAKNALVVLNVARYIAIRLVLDKHPEERGEQYYIELANRELQGIDTPRICLLVAGFIILKCDNAPLYVSRFIEGIEDLSFNKLTKQIKKLCNRDDEYKYKNARLDPKPETPEYFRNALNDVGAEIWWNEVTNSYHIESTRKIIELWASPQEQMEIIDVMNRARDKSHKDDKNNDVLDSLKAEVIGRANMLKIAYNPMSETFYHEILGEISVSDKNAIDFKTATTIFKLLDNVKNAEQEHEQTQFRTKEAELYFKETEIKLALEREKLKNVGQGENLEQTKEISTNAWQRCQETICSLASDKLIRYKSDHIALKTIIDEMNIFDKFRNTDYIAMMENTGLEDNIKPNPQAFTRYYFSGRHPNWKSNEVRIKELKRLTELASHFKSIYKSK